MRMQHLLMPVLFIGLAIASYLMFTKPVYDSTASIKTDIETHERALDQIQETQAIRDRLLNRFNQITEPNRTLMNRILPTELDRVLFLIELDRLAAQSGLTVQNVSVGGIGAAEIEDEEEEEDNNQEGEGQASSEPQLQEVSLRFSVTASYEEALVFMRNVERSAHIIDIVNLSVAQPGTPEGAGEGEEAAFVGLTSGQNTYNFRARSYWMPRKSASEN